jgi:heat shock protein HtpX
MTLVSVLLGGIAILSDWAQRGGTLGRGSRHGKSKHPVLLIAALLLIVFAALLARLLAMAVSRQREYLADATAAQYTRNPLGLARALEKIRQAGMPFHKANKGTAHLFFVNPLRRKLDDSESGLANLLSSHPPIDRRIELLYRMAGVAAPTQPRGIPPRAASLAAAE